MEKSKKAINCSNWDVQAFLHSENQGFSDCSFFIKNKHGKK